MGQVLPPQRKGRIPQYSRNKLDKLHAVFDKLKSDGIFKCPEEAGNLVEHLNPSFLVQKPNRGHGLVTAFTDVGRYCKPPPSTMPDVDSTLRTIAGWTYVIVKDITNAFYQIPLFQDSVKYCGVAKPFKGNRVIVSFKCVPFYVSWFLLCVFANDFVTYMSCVEYSNKVIDIFRL